MHTQFSQLKRTALIWQDYAGLVYLTTPVILFFLLYTVPILGIAISASIIYILSRIKIEKNETKPDNKLLVVNAIVAVIIVFLSGICGPLYNNTDWLKHFAIYNELVNSASLASNGSTLRYYLGMYITPALIEKILGTHEEGLFLSLWIALGLFIFFNQLSSVATTKTLQYLAPIVFMAFSGADIIGYFFTGFQRGQIHHFEWWAGWGQYSSAITSIFWSPQSTLPAWIIIAYLFRRPKIENALYVAPIFLFACLLWSPFIAFGISPLLGAYFFRKETLKAKINPTYLLILAVILSLLTIYITTDSSEIPKNFPWNNKCLKSLPGEPCFSFYGYLSFITLEALGPILLVLLFRETRNQLTIASTFVLLLIPLIQLGLYNEIVMYGSRPAMSAIVIAMIISIEKASLLRKVLIISILAAGFATPASEIFRSLTMNTTFNKTQSLVEFIQNKPQYEKQYLTQDNIWFIRR